MRRLLVAAVSLTLAFAAGAPAHAAFPGENGKIAFAEGATLHIVDPGGEVDTTIRNGYEPAFAPDGERIAFVRLAATNCERPEGCTWEHPVFVTNVDGTGLHRVTSGPGTDRHPAFSPDGTRIVFVRLAPDGSSIFTANVDGTGLDELIQEGSSVGYWDPQFSPDGKTIAFVRHEFRANGALASALYAMDSDGSDVRPLTPPARRLHWSLTFSPDGRRIAFERGDQIVVMKANGTNVTPLTDGHSPAFSPDGKRIVFVRYEGQQGGLYTIDSDGGDPRVVPGFPKSSSPTTPDWGPAPTFSESGRCGPSAATILGSDLTDRIHGTEAGDAIQAGGGNDVIAGRAGADRICGSPGDDVLRGGGDADRLLGGIGRDRCFGGAGRDHLVGCEPKG